MAKVEFSDYEFIKSHGINPKGRGSWAFQISFIDDASGEGPILWTHSMPLTEAKKTMRQTIISEAEKIMERKVSLVVANILP